MLLSPAMKKRPRRNDKTIIGEQKLKVTIYILRKIIARQ
jgi:hypothetical protein